MTHRLDFAVMKLQKNPCRWRCITHAQCALLLLLHATFLPLSQNFAKRKKYRLLAKTDSRHSVCSNLVLTVSLCVGVLPSFVCAVPHACIHGCPSLPAQTRWFVQDSTDRGQKRSRSRCEGGVAWPVRGAARRGLGITGGAAATPPPRDLTPLTP